MTDTAGPASDTRCAPHVEIELKLVVHDAAVLDEVANQRELAGYALRPAPERTIHDRYWDTPSRDLAARQITLRLRLEDSAPKLTLKQSGSMARGLFHQPELELPASPESWAAISAELTREGFSLAAEPGPAPDPSSWLSAAGLELTQERSTTRRVLLAERDGCTRVELALDTTTFKLGIYDIVFREIEAEVLSGQAEHALEIGAALEDRFAGRLAPSDQNKYRRGIELAERLAGL